MFARQTWTWRAAVAAHIFAVVGVLLGIYATNRGPGDEANFIYHRVILVVLVVVLAQLATSAALAPTDVDGLSLRLMPIGQPSRSPNRGSLPTEASRAPLHFSHELLPQTP